MARFIASALASPPLWHRARSEHELTALAEMPRRFENAMACVYLSLRGSGRYAFKPVLHAVKPTAGFGIGALTFVRLEGGIQRLQQIFLFAR